MKAENPYISAWSVVHVTYYLPHATIAAEKAARQLCVGTDEQLITIYYNRTRAAKGRLCSVTSSQFPQHTCSSKLADLKTKRLSSSFLRIPLNTIQQIEGKEGGIEKDDKTREGLQDLDQSTIKALCSVLQWAISLFETAHQTFQKEELYIQT